MTKCLFYHFPGWKAGIRSVQYLTSLDETRMHLNLRTVNLIILTDFKIYLNFLDMKHLSEVDFRTLWNIYDRLIFQKYLTTFVKAVNYICKKSYIIDVWKGFKCVCLFAQVIWLVIEFEKSQELFQMILFEKHCIIF